MNKTNEFTKEELVRMLIDGVINHDKEGLLKLVQEWIKNTEIKLIPREHTLMIKAIKAVNDLKDFKFAMEDNVDIDIHLVETLKPVATEVVRQQFEEWVEKNKSPSLAAWVKTVSITQFGHTMRKAGAEKKRYNDGWRYLIQIPGLVIVKKKKRASTY